MKPGKHEARALADPCPTCGAPTEPYGVMDAASGPRVALYHCCRIWRSWWSRPMGSKPTLIHQEAS